MGLWQWIWDPRRVAEPKEETCPDLPAGDDHLRAVERSEMESGTCGVMRHSFRGVQRITLDTLIRIMYICIFFSDDPCVPELRPWSEIHLFHPRRQRHTVLGRMVRNSCYRQLCWDMSSSRHVALRDSTNARFLPLIAKLHQVLFALCNLQSFYMLDKCLWIHTAYASLSLLHLNIPMSHLKKMY